MIQFKVQDQYFHQIASAQKTAEGRIASQKYVNLKAGDVVEFLANSGQYNPLKAKVTAVSTYPDFAAMLYEEGLESMLPGANSVDEGAQLYSSFGDYSKQVQASGCVAVRFTLI